MQPSDYDFDPRFSVLIFWFGIGLVCLGSMLALGLNWAGIGLSVAVVGIALSLSVVKK